MSKIVCNRLPQGELLGPSSLSLINLASTITSALRCILSLTDDLDLYRRITLPRLRSLDDLQNKSIYYCFPFLDIFFCFPV